MTAPGAVEYGARIVSLNDNPPVLVCSGDESRGSQSLRRPALSRALSLESDVVVDLSRLTFADSSLMLDLAIVARRLRRTGRVLRLCDAPPHVATLIGHAGLHRLPGVLVESRTEVVVTGAV